MIHQFLDRTDRSNRYARRVEQRQIIGTASAADEIADNTIEFFAVFQSAVVCGETRILDQVWPPDGPKQPLGHALHRAGERDVFAVATRIQITWSGMHRLITVAVHRLSGQTELGRRGADEREDGLEQ